MRVKLCSIFNEPKTVLYKEGEWSGRYLSTVYYFLLSQKYIAGRFYFHHDYIAFGIFDILTAGILIWPIWIQSYAEYKFRDSKSKILYGLYMLSFLLIPFFIIYFLKNLLCYLLALPLMPICYLVSKYKKNQFKQKQMHLEQALLNCTIEVPIEEHRKLEQAVKKDTENKNNTTTNNNNITLTLSQYLELLKESKIVYELSVSFDYIDNNFYDIDYGRILNRPLARLSKKTNINLSRTGLVINLSVANQVEKQFLLTDYFLRKFSTREQYQLIEQIFVNFQIDARIHKGTPYKSRFSFKKCFKYDNYHYEYDNYHSIKNRMLQYIENSNIIADDINTSELLTVCWKTFKVAEVLKILKAQNLPRKFWLRLISVFDENLFIDELLSRENDDSLLKKFKSNLNDYQQYTKSSPKNWINILIEGFSIKPKIKLKKAVEKYKKNNNWTDKDKVYLNKFDPFKDVFSGSKKIVPMYAHKLGKASVDGLKFIQPVKEIAYKKFLNGYISFLRQIQAAIMPEEDDGYTKQILGYQANINKALLKLVTPEVEFEKLCGLSRYQDKWLAKNDKRQPKIFTYNYKNKQTINSKPLLSKLPKPIVNIIYQYAKASNNLNTPGKRP